MNEIVLYCMNKIVDCMVPKHRDRNLKDGRRLNVNVNEQHLHKQVS